MKKIKGNFYTKREATETMGKIAKYCLNARVVEYTDYGNNGAAFGTDDSGYSDYDSFSSRYSIGMPAFTGFPMISGIGWNSMSMGWEAGLYEYGLTMPEIAEYDMTLRATLEADVEDSKYDKIKDKLYQYGAVSVY